MYEDYRRMLKEEDLDLLAVCTWPTSHCAIAVAAANAGLKGIICEKPLAVTLEEADLMLAACKARGVKLVTGHQHRFTPQAIEARRLIEAGVLGEIQIIWGHSTLDLMNNGSHAIDLINHLNGDHPVMWVFGQLDVSEHRFGQMNHPDMYAENASVTRVHYHNGVEALLDMGDRTGGFGFKVLGSDGVLFLQGASLRYMNSTSSGWIDPPLPKGPDKHKKIEDLLTAVRNDGEPQSSGQRGRAALEVIIGIFESTWHRRIIDFPVASTNLSLEKLVKDGIL